MSNTMVGFKPKSIHDTSMILRTDSYKFLQYLQLPPNTEKMYSHLVSRGGRFDELMFYGLQYVCMEYLSKPVTMEDIDYAEWRQSLHLNNGILPFQKFNRTGWERIVKEFGGYLPLRIRAVPEGTMVPAKSIMLDIENLVEEDASMAWLTGYIETIIMQTWYPSLVATHSRNLKKLLKRYLEETGNLSNLDFMLHDFGYRSSTSQESAAIGGSAHMINFRGSDTFIGNELLWIYYNEPMASFNIPANEHSTVTAWGREFEYEAFKNMIRKFGDGAIFSCLIDSYDDVNAVENILGQDLYEEIMKMNATLVVRPDSGIPHETVLKIVNSIDKRFGHTTNEKGYKVLNKVKVIQGDGINYDSLGLICETLKINGWSLDNMVFGMGSALLQKDLERDTNRMKLAASYTERNGKGYDIYKQPASDPMKHSRAGRLKLIRNEAGVLETVAATEIGENLLELVWDVGNLRRIQDLADIRARAAI